MNNMRRRLRVIFAFILLIAVGGACLILTSCNKQVLDLHLRFTWAQIRMADGNWIEGKVDSWTDFQDADQLQVTIGGVTYLTHSENVVLCSEKP